MTLRVFVYGTLKPGEENYQVYCAAKIIRTERAFAFGTLYDLPAGYPAMTLGENPVYGYVCEFPDTTVLNNLDKLEDYNPTAPSHTNLYNRQQVEVFELPDEPGNSELPLKSLGLTWVYLMDQQQVKKLGGKLVPDGWWSGRNLTMGDFVTEYF